MGMQSDVLMHPFLQVAKHKTQLRILSGHPVWVSVAPADWTCLVSWGERVALKIVCP